MSDLVKASETVGRLCDRIEQLERELAEFRSDRAEWMTAIEQANKNGQQYEALQEELSAERALADELYEGGVTSNHFGFPCYKAYRKARGLE